MFATEVPKEVSSRHSIMHGFSLFWLKHFVTDPSFSEDAPYSPVSLDIVIPIVEKDLETLPFVVASVRGLIMHPINNIFIVAPDSKRIRDEVTRLGLSFIDENVLLPKSLNEKFFSGWIKQQFIKLNADKIVTTEYFLVLDADTIFTRPQIFIFQGKVMLNVADEYSLPTKKYVKKILGYGKLHHFSFCVHHLVYETKKLHYLKNYIEERYSKPWHEVISDLDEYEMSGSSESELYVGFVLKNYRDEFKIVYGRNIELQRSKLSSFELILPWACERSKSISFHSFS